MSYTPDYYRNGGDFHAVEPSAEVVAIADGDMVKVASLKELHRLHKESQIHKFTEADYDDHLNNWKVIKVAEEHVPHGVNYFMKVFINPNHNIHIRVHREVHEPKYNFHALHKTIKHNNETSIWHDEEPLSYFEY